MDAEAVLFVDDRESQVGELDLVLDQRMRADDDIDRAFGQTAHCLLLQLLAVAPGEQRQPHARRFGEGRYGGEVLAGQQFGRRHQGGLGAGLDRNEHGEEGYQGLAAADVPLQQADHSLGLRHVGRDLVDGALLAPGQLEGQGI